MSLKRFLLRQAVCNALLRHESDDHEITMAGENVFDTRLDPLRFTQDETNVPCITVYTDDDTSKLLNRASNGGPRLRHVDLRLELTISSFETATYEIDGKKKSGRAQFLPTTDPELEAKLDMFEQQVAWALYGYVGRDQTDNVTSLVVQFEDVDSAPHRDETAASRLAMRRVIYRCRINDDCPPYVRAGGPPSGKRQLVANDFPVADWLKDFLVTAQNVPSMENAVRALAGDISGARVLPLLKYIDVNVDIVEPITDPAVLATVKRANAPDGRIDCKAVWEIP